MKMNANQAELVQMLHYRRPEGSHTQKMFCKRFLDPHMTPDADNNYVRVIGNSPRFMFTAHHDTVHRFEGYQQVEVSKELVARLPVSSKSNCLGADCTTGVWLILEMIREEIPGVYVVFAGEECGGIGSSAMERAYPTFLEHVEAVISFDRYGYNSVISHQGLRSASDEFCMALAAMLSDNHEPDEFGTFTDSANFTDLIGECTNISVGYHSQHTTRETQDLVYADWLADMLCTIRWEALPIVRTPGEWDPYDMGMYGGLYTSPYTMGYTNGSDSMYPGDPDEYVDLRDVVEAYPKATAKLLKEFGYDVETLLTEIKFNDDPLPLKKKDVA